MVQIDNVFDRAVALLASQFRGEKDNGELTNFQKLIKVFADEVQDLEDVNWELKTERWLSTGVGQQLDEIGIILGLSRLQNESDEDYRERLQFQIFINNSSGTPEDIIRALSFLTNATHIGYFEVDYAFFQLETNGMKWPVPLNDLNEAIFRLSPAGVNYAPITLTLNNPIVFQFSGDLQSDPLFLAPNVLDPSELHNLLIQPQNAILYVSAGSVENNSGNGGFDELNFPLQTAGTFSELVQINGNFPARRF